VDITGMKEGSTTQKHPLPSFIKTACLAFAFAICPPPPPPL
jgi:hypothetical protein